MSDDRADLDLTGAQLRADRRDVPAFAAALAARLEDVAGDLVTVERKRAGLLDSRKVVRSVRCAVGEEVYVLAVDDGRATATRAKAVRGITLRTQELPVGDWADALVAALAAHADASSEAWSALHDLVAR